MPVASPYLNLPAERFWKTGVAAVTPFTVKRLYSPKFSIVPSDKIATAGSCFALHIAKQLRARGVQVIDAEPAPPGLSEKDAMDHGYNQFSARYGNVYTSPHLLQLLREALGQFTPAVPYWERNGVWYDAMRPSVASSTNLEHLRLDRARHLEKFRSVVENARVFVFTFGLTEGWVHTESGTVYPTAPGTIAGQYDPEIFHFHNFDYAETLQAFWEFRKLARKINKKIRFLLTVSPVPLTATATEAHVLPATIYSKSVLRAVAGYLHSKLQDVDYFPSYEIIASHFSRGVFYEPNLREVGSAGVDTVMRVFLEGHTNLATSSATESTPTARRRRQSSEERGDAFCDDALLEAFAT